jgi:hypothetical protein
MFADEPEHEVLRRKAKILSTMYDWLEYLAGQSYTFGALGIAEAVLFLWKEHFETNPLYSRLQNRLPPQSAALKIFRNLADRLPCPRPTKYSQALNSVAGELLVNAGTCRGRERRSREAVTQKARCDPLML